MSKHLEEKKILILGSNGRIGMKIVDYSLKKGYIPAGVDFAVSPLSKSLEEFEYYSLDLQQVHPLVSVILGIAPDVIVFAAGVNDLDFCEQEQEFAYSVNVETVRNIVSISRELKSKLVFLSCAYVFDGKSEFPYREDALPQPLNFYGKTKLEAEKLVATLDDHLIIRVSYPFFSPLVKRGFFRDIITTLSKGEKLVLPVDNKISPVSIDFLVEGMMALLDLEEKGIYHIGSDKIVSEYQFANMIAEIFEFDTNLIEGKNLEEFSFIAPRPRNLALDSSKFLEKVEFSFPTLEDSLNYCKNLYFSEEKEQEADE